MADASSEGNFGCQRCWPVSPDDAWEARAGLSHQATRIDESHLIASVLGCPVCSQRFVSVFIETIDWVGGDDPQCWVQLPLTPEEAERLTREPVTEADLHGLGGDRRSLLKGFLRGGVEKCMWTKGLSIGWHD